MAIGRAGHACSIHNDALWVLGGFGNARGGRDERQALRSVEVRLRTVLFLVTMEYGICNVVVIDVADVDSVGEVCGLLLLLVAVVVRDGCCCCCSFCCC